MVCGIRPGKTVFKCSMINSGRQVRHDFGTITVNGTLMSSGKTHLADSFPGFWHTPFLPAITQSPSEEHSGSFVNPSTTTALVKKTEIPINSNAFLKIPCFLFIG